MRLEKKERASPVEPCPLGKKEHEMGWESKYSIKGDEEVGHQPAVVSAYSSACNRKGIPSTDL